MMILLKEIGRKVKRLAIPVLFLVSIAAHSQSLETLNQQRIDRTKNGMLVLGVWAAGNMVASPILKQQASGSDRYFYNMNVYWNAINLVIAGFGYYSATHDDPSQSLSETVKLQHQTEKLLLYNSGLDIAYVMTGLFLKERGINKNSLKLQGYGDSLILQGSFLAVFDILFYLSQRQGSKGIENVLHRVSIAPTGFSLRLNL